MFKYYFYLAKASYAGNVLQSSGVLEVEPLSPETGKPGLLFAEVKKVAAETAEKSFRKKFPDLKAEDIKILIEAFNEVT